MDKVLPESDGPFGMMGNEPVLPWDAISVADILAPLWGMTRKEAQSRMANNFRELVLQTDNELRPI